MISIIVAMDQNNLIGNDNNLPWYYPDDLKYFKKITLNKSVLMGYNTYQSIISRIGKALPKRKNYVLTYQSTIEGGGIIVKDLNKLLNDLKEEELFIIGGKMVYEQFLPVANRLYLTRIQKEYSGNVFFPKINFSQFKLISCEKHEDLSFEIYERI